MMNRLEILHRITDLEDSHCADCLRKAEFRRLDANKITHMCITQCEIGKQIRELGKNLEGKEARPNQIGVRVFKATPEELERMVREYTTAEIAKLYGVSAALISRYKKKWGITKKGMKGA